MATFLVKYSEPNYVEYEIIADSEEEAAKRFLDWKMSQAGIEQIASDLSNSDCYAECAEPYRLTGENFQNKKTSANFRTEHIRLA